MEEANPVDPYLGLLNPTAIRTAKTSDEFWSF